MEPGRSGARRSLGEQIESCGRKSSKRMEKERERIIKGRVEGIDGKREKE